MGKLKERIKFWKKIDIVQFIKLNYISSQIIRKGKGKVIPYIGAIVDLDNTAKIYIQDGDVEIGTDKLKGSKTETYIRFQKNAIWNVKSGCKIAYGSTIEVLEDGQLNSGYFTMNSWSTLIVKKRIDLGQDVMIARRVIIFDSDFHPIINESGKEINSSKDIMIGNHVWIGANSVILKGVRIGESSIVAANSLITKDITNNTLVGVKSNFAILKEQIDWRR